MTANLIAGLALVVLVVAVAVVVVIDWRRSTLRDDNTRLQTELDGARVKLRELDEQLVTVTRERDQARTVANDLTELLAQAGERLFRKRGAR